MVLEINNADELLSQTGTQLGPTDWMTVTQDAVNQFADATGDHQWIHVDESRAAAGPFGGTIAHGYMTLSLVSFFLPQLLTVNNIAMGINYGCDRVRFPNAVRVGSRLRASGEFLKTEAKGAAVQMWIRVTIEVEGQERPCCVADTIGRYMFGAEVESSQKIADHG